MDTLERRKDAYIDGGTETGVVFPWVFTIAVAFRVVDVFDLLGSAQGGRLGDCKKGMEGMRTGRYTPRRSGVTSNSLVAYPWALMRCVRRLEIGRFGL